MRATALLQRLPHSTDTERARPRGRGRRKRASFAHTVELHVVAPAAACAQDPATSAGRDSALARVRSAGGPIDNACYTCSCGFVFAASVSTTVSCPHCGAGQAW
jgi:hypothetical protein